MKLRSDGIRLCIVGLTLATLAFATPVWPLVLPASQSEQAQSQQVFGIALPAWLGVLSDSLRAVVGEEASQLEPAVPTLTEPISQEQSLTSDPSDSNTTDHVANIDPDG